MIGALSLLAAAPGWAICPASDCSTSAATVLVRQDCTDLANCFEDIRLLTGVAEESTLCSSLVINNSLDFGDFVAGTSGPPATPCETDGWLWSAHVHSAASPVVIDIGPGTFGSFVCPYNGTRHGHVKIRGAGRDQTILGFDTTTDPQSWEMSGISIFGCDELVLSELTARGLLYGVRWIGGGEAYWSRVDMFADRDEMSGGLKAGWADICYSTDAEESVHFIYDSRSVVSGAGNQNAGYLSDCAKTYYFGGAIVNSTTVGLQGSAGVMLGRYSAASSGDGRFEGFGVEIVVDAERASIAEALAAGVDVYAGSSAELLDGSIEVEVVPEEGAGDMDAAGIRTQGGGSARTLGTAFQVNAPSGSEQDRLDL